MKEIKVIIFLALIMSASLLNAQSLIQPIDASIEFDNAQRPCLQVNLDPEAKTLKKAWKDYLKDNHDFKLKGIGFLSNKVLLSAEKVVVEKISSKATDFYTHIVEDENGSEMKVFARHGYDIYISEDQSPSEYLALRGILENFVKYYLPIYYENQIEDTQKRVKLLTRESENLKDNIEDNSDKIENLKEEISELEESIKTNNALLEEAETKLTVRKEKLARIRTQINE